MQQELLQCHSEQSQTLNQQLSALQDRYKMLKRYIDKAYEDKLNDRIPEEMWAQKNNEWLLEQARVKKQIDSLEDHQQDYINKGMLLIGLMQGAESTYKKADPTKRRRLVEIISSDSFLESGNIRFSYKKPFDLLAKSKAREMWCAEGDLNPHAEAHAPQTCVSTNSTIRANHSFASYFILDCQMRLPEEPKLIYQIRIQFSLNH